MSATATIVPCPNCGAKNRVADRGTGIQAVCGKCRTPLAVDGGQFSGEPVELTDASFNAILDQAGDRPVLVDCWAPWCGPCRMIAPSIDAIAAQARGRYVVAKLNVDHNARVATEYDISSIPTLLIFKQGRLIDRIVGLQSQQAIAARLMAHI